MDRSISVVVPVYNSEKTLPDLIKRLIPALKDICSDFEVILVNDGSKDGSWDVTQALAKEHPAVRGIELMRNFGQHNALLCGVRQARCAYTVTIDDDLQHPPEEIHKLVAEIEKGYDVVYGVPTTRVHARWRRVSSQLTKNFFARVLNIPGIKHFSAFRIFRTDIRRAFAQFDSPNVVLDALLTWGTEKYGTVAVNESERTVGQSNYTFGKLVKYAMVVLTGFSTLPLRVASVIGFVFTLFGMCVLAYVLLLTILEGSIPGFPFLASIVSIFSGVQLFALGIFGEYLARIFNRSTNHPTYIIDKETPKQP